MNGFRSTLLLLTCLIPSLSIADPEWELLRVSGASMEPTIGHGEYVCLHRRVSEYNVGDLIAIRLLDNKPPLLKRVVAIAGDKVELIGNQLIRNDTVISKLQQTSALQIQLARYNNMVPQNNLIALGDNRDQSFDSSEFGFIDHSQVIGTVETSTAKCSLGGRGLE